MIWRTATTTGAPDTASRTTASSRRMKTVILLCASTSLLTTAAAAAEMWRYVLLLRGRTEVLSGSLVRASDQFVDTAGTAALLAAVVTAALLVPLLVGLHGLTAVRAGSSPGRTAAAVLARLVVPGWNVHGVGVVAGEIDGALRPPDAYRCGPRRLSRLVVAVWLAWAADAVLVVLTLVRAFGTSDQAVADTVELHIFVDLAGAVVAALWTVLLIRWSAVLAGRSRRGPDARWVVRPPVPTRAAG